MNDKVFRVLQFLNYQKNSDSKYYLHSPFVYQFYLNVLEGSPSPTTTAIEAYRVKLSTLPDSVLMHDFGAAPTTTTRYIADLATHASMPYHYGLVLSRAVKYFSPNRIIELGTCLGIGTAYIATAHPEAIVHTIEGSSALQEYSNQLFTEMSIVNVQPHHGTFEEILPELLAGIQSVDLAFIDGHHRYAPTMRYFEQILDHCHAESVVILDDIHWSEEMLHTWEEIKQHPRVRLTIDIYRMGFVFLTDDKLAKEHFVLRY